MPNLKVEKNKLLRVIKTSGQNFEFYRYNTKFGQKLDTHSIICNIEGIFHTTSGHVSFIFADAGKSVSTKKTLQPYILCLFDESVLIKTDDCVKINDKEFKVTKTVNVNEMNLCYEICLEASDE